MGMHVDAAGKYVSARRIDQLLCAIGNPLGNLYNLAVSDANVSPIVVCGCNDPPVGNLNVHLLLPSSESQCQMSKSKCQIKTRCFNVKTSKFSEESYS